MSRTLRLTMVAALIAAGPLLGACAGSGATGSTTAAAMPAAPTPEGRLKNLVWNSAWATACGFQLDTAKLKANYMAYEVAAGTDPAKIASLGNSFDKLHGSIRNMAVGRPDECTEDRIGRIRETVGRYLANDFSPGGAV